MEALPKVSELSSASSPRPSIGLLIFRMVMSIECYRLEAPPPQSPSPYITERLYEAA